MPAGKHKRSAAYDAFASLLTRPEPDPEQLWQEAKTQVDFNCGIPVLDDSTIKSRCYHTGISWFKAKTSIIRAAVRA